MKNIFYTIFYFFQSISACSIWNLEAISIIVGCLMDWLDWHHVVSIEISLGLLRCVYMLVKDDSLNMLMLIPSPFHDVLSYLFEEFVH